MSTKISATIYLYLENSDLFLKFYMIIFAQASLMYSVAPLN